MPTLPNDPSRALQNSQAVLAKWLGADLRSVFRQLLELGFAAVVPFGLILEDVQALYDFGQAYAQTS